jgi:hypothetical protein
VHDLNLVLTSTHLVEHLAPINQFAPTKREKRISNGACQRILTVDNSDALSQQNILENGSNKCFT